MDIKAMRYFIGAAENLSFTKTAIEQNVTQTAISLSISKMEDELGFQLFYRKGRSVHLTEAGHEFYENIIYVVKKYEQAVEKSLKTATGKVGEIRIGVPDCVLGMSLVSSLLVFKNAYPQMYVKTVIIPPHKVMQAIDTREIDAAVGFPQEFESNPGLQYRVFRKDKLMVAMAPHHPFAAYSDITVAQLSTQTAAVVHPEKAPMVDRYMQSLWEKIDFKPANVIHATTLDDALLDVAIGNAIILITEQSKPFCSPSLVYHHLRGSEKLNIEIAIAWDKSRNSPIIKGLLWALLGDSLEIQPE